MINSVYTLLKRTKTSFGGFIRPGVHSDIASKEVILSIGYRENHAISKSDIIFYRKLIKWCNRTITEKKPHSRIWFQEVLHQFWPDRGCFIYSVRPGFLLTRHAFLAESKLQRSSDSWEQLLTIREIDFSRILLTGASAFNRFTLFSGGRRAKAKFSRPREEASNFRVLASAYPLSNVFTSPERSFSASDSRRISETRGLSEFEPRLG